MEARGSVARWCVGAVSTLGKTLQRYFSALALPALVLISALELHRNSLQKNMSSTTCHGFVKIAGQLLLGKLVIVRLFFVLLFCNIILPGFTAVGTHSCEVVKTFLVWKYEKVICCGNEYGMFF